MPNKGVRKVKIDGACNEAAQWLEGQPDAQTAWQNCENPQWMLWWVDKCGIDDRTRRKAERNRKYREENCEKVLERKRMRRDARRQHAYAAGVITLFPQVLQDAVSQTPTQGVT
jgi:hypothetical protein